MRKTFWDRKIPTLLGILIITIAIGFTTLLVGQNTFFIQQASPTTNPQGLRITNISDSSFTVSYTTSGPFLGSLNFGKDQNLGQTVADDKDKGGVTEHQIHSLTVKNLIPSTKYFFSVISGQDTYLNNGTPYTVTTGPQIEQKSGSSFIVGKVVTTGGSSPKEAIAYIATDGSQALSSLVGSDGSYTISLEFLRSEDLSTFFNFKPGSVIKILIVSDSGSSTAQISVKDVNQVPTIVIGNSYDFTQGETPQVASQSASIATLPPIPNSVSQNGPKITSPVKDQQFSSQKPTFRGTGIPNDKISITIQSTQEIQGQATVDSSGNWTFAPTAPLAPGQHTITITAKDASGILRTISQTFTILGTQTAEAATPSPTPTISPTPTPTPVAISPSPIASTSPSPTPIVIATPPPTPRPTLPPTGTSEVSTGIMGMAIAVIGGFFFLLSKVLL